MLVGTLIKPVTTRETRHRGIRHDSVSKRNAAAASINPEGVLGPHYEFLYRETSPMDTHADSLRRIQAKDEAKVHRQLPRIYNKKYDFSNMPTATR